ncbi:hypothetical protein [Salisaeta icosahedral phage 1]|uniref:hypothetical protein n=1 Tax=Salisaeta icosahedral phage 1 TaxID=1183239 RepID=UPI00025EA928|nr:hypothetical protein A322_gp27 [Salisaeta icosahedral phage 1]AFJ21482.1 hypothetical protein [Salisaeta icosahedral phage 1]
MKKEYLQPCPLSWVEGVLKAKVQRGERFTMQDAVQSYLLDKLRGHERSKAAYARLWSWGRTTLYRKWDQIQADAESQKSFYGSGPNTHKESGTPGGTVVEQSRNSEWNSRGTGDGTPAPPPNQGAAPTNADNATPDGTPNGTSVEHPVVQSRNTGDTGGGTPYISESLDNREKSIHTTPACAQEEPTPKDSYTAAQQIFEQHLGKRLSGSMAIEKIAQLAEAQEGSMGWDALKEVCDEIDNRGWLKTSQLVLRKLQSQVELMEENDGNIYPIAEEHTEANVQQQPRRKNDRRNAQSDPAGTFEEIYRAASTTFD